MSVINSFISSVGPFFLLLGLLIFVHELGHFLVAKYFGVRVEVFSLGFGKRLLSYQGRETNYCLSVIPLGGYVKMFGDDPSAEVPEAERSRAFLHKPVLQRIAIVLAGPLMNLFFAALLLILIGGMGEDQPGPFVGDLASDSRAFQDGFRSGDQVVAIDGQPVATWGQVRRQVEEDVGKNLQFTIQRSGASEPIQLSATPTYGENENIFSFHRQVGMIPGLTSESRAATLGVFDPKSPAALAGVKSLDLALSINDQKINYWRDLGPALQRIAQSGEKTLRLGVRDVEKDDKPENTRVLTLTLPKNWSQVTDEKELIRSLGLESAELYIYQTKKGSPADKAGLLAKDKVVRIQNQEVQSWSDVLNRVKAFDPQTKTMEFTILRDGQEKSFAITPEMTKTMNPLKGQEERRFTIGIVSGYFPLGPQTVFYRVSGVLQALRNGLRETVNMGEFMIMTLVRLAQGEVSPKNIGGVITIGRVASHSFAAGITTFLRTMAVISMNLFLLNLLPVPVLDGGHLVFYTIEGLRGAPLSMRKMELAQQIGLMLLMFLMVFAFFNDISNLLSTHW